MMRTTKLAFMVAALLSVCQVIGAAEEAEFVPVELELISEQDAIVPGKKFTVGVRQKMLPGYHTYWRNPGTVGLGMRLKWKLPTGFSAGEIQWPAPEIGKMAVYQIWGYHKTALMLVDITPPKDLKVGSRIELRTQAIWMCCGKSCYPGHKMLSLTLPVASKAAPIKKTVPAFEETRKDQPRTSDAWNLSCELKGDRYRLRIQPGNGKTLPKNIQFFGYDRVVSSDKGQKTRRKGSGVIINMQHEEHTGERLPRLRGMLSCSGEWEPGIRNLAVDIPITESK